VRWTECVETLIQAGVDRFVELGPGTTLTAMGKRINPDVAWTSVAGPTALAEVGI
jgi:[acyl-carrier-protein] S-malonyltransferase